MTKYRKALNAALVGLVKGTAPLIEKYEKECSGPMNEYTAKKAKELKAKIEALKEDAADQVDEAHKAYLERLRKKAVSLTGADIDKADYVLLESNLYTLNQEEFDLLQDKYEGNRAMERILAGYAEKKGMEYYEKTGSSIDEHGENRVLSCRFMSDKEKKALAGQLHKEARSWVYKGESGTVADYVIAMAGDMFGAADKLKE